ncbi:hypothetical protein GGI35DRAFT_481760 [Trichoderma velutinum]
MSGLEVLGAITGVLGVLPVAVEALKTYKKFISSIRNAARDLASLIRDLETEQVRLRTTCEVLLEGIAPLSMIDDMTKDPFGAAWEQYSDLLRVRLRESERQFKSHTLDMHDAAMELRKKLCIYGDGSSRPTDKVSIIRELKKGASFTLKKKDYIEIVSRIKRGNLALSELASKGLGLESSRKKRSQVRLIRLVRGLSDGIYNAIRNATTCTCVTPHQVCLELTPRKKVLIPSDVDDVVAQNFEFHVAFGSDSKIGNTDNHGAYNLINGQLMDRWNNIYFRAFNISEIAKICIMVPQRQNFRGRRYTTGNFSSGHVLPAGSRPLPDVHWKKGGQLKVARFDYPEKLKVAHAIAVNTLHLHSTRWVEESLTLDNVIFFLPTSSDGEHGLDTIFLDQPFVVKNLLTSQRKKSTSWNTSRPVNLAIFSVGVLLMQVMVGKTESALEMAGVMDVNTVLSKRDTGKRLLGQLLESGGANYKSAVEWCFDSVLQVAGLQNEKCCQQFFQEVVLRLEEDVQFLSEN